MSYKETMLKTYVVGVTKDNIEDKLKEHQRELVKIILDLECSNIDITTKVKMMSYKEAALYTEIYGEKNE